MLTTGRLLFFTVVLVFGLMAVVKLLYRHLLHWSLHGHPFRFSVLLSKSAT